MGLYHERGNIGIIFEARTCVRGSPSRTHLESGIRGRIVPSGLTRGTRLGYAVLQLSTNPSQITCNIFPCTNIMSTYSQTIATMSYTSG